MPGSSDYVACGVVSYSNQSKVDLLGVDAGAHRGPRRGQRAGRAGHGCRHPSRAAAPKSASRSRESRAPVEAREAKPVGTVVIALERPTGALVRTRRMLGGRDLIRAMAAHGALDMLRRLLTGRPGAVGSPNLVPVMPVVALSLGYLVGSIPFAFLVGRLVIAASTSGGPAAATSAPPMSCAPAGWQSPCACCCSTWPRARRACCGSPG